VRGVRRVSPDVSIGRDGNDQESVAAIVLDVGKRMWQTARILATENASVLGL